jgi:endonuclease I
MRCITDRQCTIMNPRYPFIVADLHNHYPALSRVELVRRNAQFGELADELPSKFADIGCDMRTSFQLVEPRDEAKGNIARAIFYMHVEYGFPSSAWCRCTRPGTAWTRRTTKNAHATTGSKCCRTPAIALSMIRRWWIS